MLSYIRMTSMAIKYCKYGSFVEVEDIQNEIQMFLLLLFIHVPCSPYKGMVWETSMKHFEKVLYQIDISMLCPYLFQPWSSHKWPTYIWTKLEDWLSEVLKKNEIIFFSLLNPYKGVLILKMLMFWDFWKKIFMHYVWKKSKHHEWKG